MPLLPTAHTCQFPGGVHHSQEWLHRPHKGCIFQDTSAMAYCCRMKTVHSQHPFNQLCTLHQICMLTDLRLAISSAI